MRKVLLAVRLDPQRAYFFRRLAGYWDRTLSDCLDEALADYMEDARKQWGEGKPDADRMWAKWDKEYQQKYLGS